MENGYENEYETNKTNETMEDTNLEEQNTKANEVADDKESEQELNNTTKDTKQDDETGTDETLENQNEELDEISKLTKENTELKEKYTRLLAEFENFRKRNDKERLTMIDLGASEVLTKLLPVIDNFDRAIESLNNQNINSDSSTSNEVDESTAKKQEENFAKGIEQIYKQMNKFLEDLNVKKIDALGKQFDPNLHNAVMTDEESDAEEGTITADLQPGYTYKDQILRHSMVKVKK